MQALLIRCKECNITLNRKKMILGNSNVKFAGHIVGTHGIEVYLAKIEAVNNF